MAKEIMARSAEGGSIDTALALERNAIQWLQNAPDIQAVMDMYRKQPNNLTQSQKEANKMSDR